MESSVNRLEIVRTEVDKIACGMADETERLCACQHLYGVSKLCALFAIKRNLNPELTAISGMLHDIYAYRTGITQLHAHNSAEDARPTIRDMGIFSSDEQKIILSAIFHHSDKGHLHDEYDEVLKDADVLQHFLYDTSLPISRKDVPRLRNMLNEFGLRFDLTIADQAKQALPSARSEDRSRALAEVAERLASKGIVGQAGDAHYEAIARYWPGDDVQSELKNSWCAAFVYHCCMQAGWVLPIRHPLGPSRFAAVLAWYEWARLPEASFYFKEESGFAPQRGDIVIYDDIIDRPNKPADSLSRDHIGVLLSCDSNTMMVAEGNVNNRNKSGIITRKRHERVDGFIRISDDYSYDGWKYDYKTHALRMVPYQQ